MKIHIFYRHYNIEGSDSVSTGGIYRHRPIWFDYEKCFTNLLATIKDRDDVELHVVMDGSINSNFIGKYKKYFTSHEIEGGSDRKSFLSTYEIAKSIKTDDNDLYYFLENDYVHIPGWVDKIKELFSTYKLSHYVSLYDHNDKYTAPMYENLVSKILTTNTHHWRTTPSTCGTYVVNKKVFLEDYHVPFDMRGDHNKFLWLNKNKGRVVITPLPSLSTHGMEDYLAPTINWNQTINNTQL